MANHSSILAWRIPWTEEPVTFSFIDIKQAVNVAQFSYNERMIIAVKEAVVNHPDPSLTKMLILPAVRSGGYCYS